MWRWQRKNKEEKNVKKKFCYQKNKNVSDFFFNIFLLFIKQYL